MRFVGCFMDVSFSAWLAVDRRLFPELFLKSFGKQWGETQDAGAQTTDVRLSSESNVVLLDRPASARHATSFEVGMHDAMATCFRLYGISTREQRWHSEQFEGSTYEDTSLPFSAVALASRWSSSVDDDDSKERASWRRSETALCFLGCYQAVLDSAGRRHPEASLAGFLETKVVKTFDGSICWFWGISWTSLEIGKIRFSNRFEARRTFNQDVSSETAVSGNPKTASKSKPQNPPDVS
eukprot:5924634-Pyramimonas_sp.AAC.1